MINDPPKRKKRIPNEMRFSPIFQKDSANSDAVFDFSIGYAGKRKCEAESLGKIVDGSTQKCKNCHFLAALHHNP